MTEQTLKMKIEKLLISVGQRYDNAQHPALLIHTHTDEIIALILSEIDKAALTEEQFDELPDDLISVYDEPIDQKEGILRTKKMIAAAQLEAIKKQLRV